ncbi:MAG: glycosyltransferase family 4 protein [Nanoarchaeota archaeon]|nr:glycosyltransferase family 4 protein [Nanoarchaeota archaeon]
MKILIFSWRDIKHPEAGGSELYFHEMAKRWAKKGHKVDWIVGGWDKCLKNEEIDSMRITRVGNEFTLYLLAPLEYLKLKDKPEVILDVSNGIPFFTPLFSKKKKFLHMHHSHREVWFKEVYPKGGKYKIVALICWFLENKLAPLIYRDVPSITISQSSAEEIIKDKLIFDKPEIVNPGINFPKYKKFSKNKKPAILFLNRVKKYKGLDVLLKAVSELKSQGKDKFETWVAGDGDFLPEMKEYVKREKLENIKFFGRVSEEKKRELMQKSWIFVNPSFKEGWGIVNIEANYFGTPVLGSNVGGIKDSVVDGKTGLLFGYGNSKELAEKIDYLINNRKTLSKMSRYSRSYSKKFAWSEKAEEYLKVLRKS